MKFKKIFFSGGNPFHATDLLLYTHGNYGKSLFLMFSGGIESDQWQEMGLRYIKKSVITISRDIAYSMNR